MKKLSILLIFSLMMIFFSSPGYAQAGDTKEYKLETQQDVYRLLDDANKGDINAINKLDSFKAFDKMEVSKALKNIKLTTAERSRSIKFDDGSEIVLELVLDDQSTQSTLSNIELQASYINSSCCYQVKIAGVEVARYTLYIHYYGDSSGNCWGLTTNDGSSAVYPYTITKNGAQPIVTQGLYVQSRGSGDFYFLGKASFTVTLTMWGYSNPTNNWWKTDIS